MEKNIVSELQNETISFKINRIGRNSECSAKEKDATILELRNHVQSTSLYIFLSFSFRYILMMISNIE